MQISNKNLKGRIKLTKQVHLDVVEHTISKYNYASVKRRPKM